MKKSLLALNMKCAKICFILFLILSSSSFIHSSAQYTVLHNYKDSTGSYPYGSLTPIGNTLYGLATAGGIHDSGCVFSITTNGTSYRDLFDFRYSQGAFPYGSLTLYRN